MWWMSFSHLPPVVLKTQNRSSPQTKHQSHRLPRVMGARVRATPIRPMRSCGGRRLCETANRRHVVLPRFVWQSRNANRLTGSHLSPGQRSCSADVQRPPASHDRCNLPHAPASRALVSSSSVQPAHGPPAPAPSALMLHFGTCGRPQHATASPVAHTHPMHSLPRLHSQR